MFFGYKYLLNCNSRPNDREGPCLTGMFITNKKFWHIKLPQKSVTKKIPLVLLTESQG